VTDRVVVFLMLAPFLVAGTVRGLMFLRDGW